MATDTVINEFQPVYLQRENEWVRCVVLARNWDWEEEGLYELKSRDECHHAAYRSEIHTEAEHAIWLLMQ